MEHVPLDAGLVSKMSVLGSSDNYVAAYQETASPPLCVSKSQNPTIVGPYLNILEPLSMFWGARHLTETWHWPGISPQSGILRSMPDRAKETRLVQGPMKTAAWLKLKNPSLGDLEPQ